MITGDTGIRFEFDTGAVGNRVSGLPARTSIWIRRTLMRCRRSVGSRSICIIPCSSRSPLRTFFGGVMSSPRTTNRTKTESFALADTLAFIDDRLLVTLGARHQRIEQNSYDYNSGSELSAYDESTVTPIFGVVAKALGARLAVRKLHRGLAPGAEVPAVIGGVAVANANETFDPFKSKQYEVGAKYDGGTLGGSVAIFRINQPSTLLVGNVVTESGEQRNQGVELSVFGQLSPDVRLLGGLTLLSAENRRGDIPANDGKDVIGVPDTQANVGVEWDILQALSVDGRLVYTGSQPASADNRLEIPSWTRLDVGARYGIKWDQREVTLRARVDNVTDENYWASVGGSFGANYLVMGGPRTFVVSASVDF